MRSQADRENRITTSSERIGSSFGRLRRALPDLTSCRLTPHASLLALFLLSGCAGTPPPPDWKMNAQGALEGFEKAYLDGNSKLANLNFERARREIARTGRPDLVARADLIRCATETAALVTDHCAVTASLPAETVAAERAYAAFVAGRWEGLAADELPAPYRPLVKAKDEAAREQAVREIKDPLSRLIAAGILFQQGRLTPAALAMAVDTASSQGWRRPLLAWLNVQLQRAEAAGDRDAAAGLRQRIDLVLASLPAEK